MKRWCPGLDRIRVGSRTGLEDYMSNWAHTFWFWLLVENIGKILEQQCSLYNTWKRKQSGLTASASASSQKGPKSALPLPLLHHCCKEIEHFSLVKEYIWGTNLIPNNRKLFLTGKSFLYYTQLQYDYFHWRFCVLFIETKFFYHVPSPDSFVVLYYLTGTFILQE